MKHPASLTILAPATSKRTPLLDTPEDVYEQVSQSFAEEELVNLTMAIVTINGWNRLMIGFRAVPRERICS